MIGALNTRIDPKLAVVPTIQRADNVYRTRTGEWAKRHGYTILPNAFESAQGYTIDSIRKLAARGSELVVFDTRRMWSWSPTLQKFLDLSSAFGSGLNTWPDQTVCTHELLRYDSDPPVDPFEQPVFGLRDVAFGGGCILNAWQHIENDAISSHIFFSAVSSDGQFRRIPTGASAGGVVKETRPKVAFAGGWFLIFFVVEGGGASTLKVTGYNPTTNSTRAVTNVATDLRDVSLGQPHYDIQVRSDDSNKVVVAYRSNTPNVKALEWDGTTNTQTIATATVVAADDAAGGIGWIDTTVGGVAAGLRLLTAVNSATGVVRRRLSTTTLAQLGIVTVQASPGDVSACTGVYNGTDDIVCWEVQHATDFERIFVRYAYVSGAGVTDFRFLVRNGGLASKAFFVTPTGAAGPTAYVLLRNTWEAQGSYFLASLRAASGTTFFETDSIPSCVAKILEGKAEFGAGSRNALSSVAQATATKVVFALAEILDVVKTAALETTLLRPLDCLVEFSGRMPEPVQFSTQLFAPGSMPRIYGGNKVREVGWQTDPTKLTLTAFGVGTGALSAGSYQYTHCFVYKDDEGRVWRSGPGLVRSVTVVNTGSVTIDRKNPFWHSHVSGTLKSGGVSWVEIYRTVANGTVFFRLPFSPVNEDLGITATADVTSHDDIIADADLILNPQLYASSGELFNESPPPCIGAVVQGDRIVVIDAEKPTSVAASKEFQPGQGTGWHADLKVEVEGDGPNTALALIEGRIIVFKRQAIYMLSGDWPDANGIGSLPLVQKIATGWGTVEPESVCQVTDGVWFKDPAKGLCFISRGLEITQPGKAVQLYDGNDIVAATIVEQFEQVRFLTASGNSPQFDYFEKQWMTFFGTTGISQPRTAAAVAGGIYYISAANRVYFYDTTSFADNGSLIFADLIMRLSFAGMSGIQRIDRLVLMGDMIDTGGGMTIRLTDDYGGASGRVDKFVAQNQLSNQRDPAAAVPGTFALEVRPKNPRSATLALQVFWPNSFLLSGLLTAGVRLSGISAEVGFRATPGLRKLHPKMRI